MIASPTTTQQRGLVILLLVFAAYVLVRVAL
jgi:hypothetical protein